MLFSIEMVLKTRFLIYCQLTSTKLPCRFLFCD